MAYVPPKLKREYINPMFRILRSGKEELFRHDCAKCKKSYDGKAPGTWFQRADKHDVWCWVCKECRS